MKLDHSDAIIHNQIVKLEEEHFLLNRRLRDRDRSKFAAPLAGLKEQAERTLALIQSDEREGA